MSAELDPTAEGPRSRWSGLVALVVVGVWIPLLATAPMILGGMLWSRFGFKTDLPLRHLTQAGLTSLFVLTFILVTGRGRMLIPTRPKRLWVLLLFLPLMFVNVVRGPLAELTALILVAHVADNYLVGFWEEFLFRGLIQDRLSDLGARGSALATAVMFGLLHANEGVPAVLIAFGIGLSFSVARASLGLWPLVFIHGTIDLVVNLFERRWEHQFTFGATVVAVYFLGSLVCLLRPRAEPEA